MLEGVLLAVLAGVLLGLYALPEKFTKGFKFENTWGLFFLINMLIVPFIAMAMLMNGPSEILAAVPSDVLLKMAFASVLWGIGVMLWGKAINYIGLSLGFSLFIGTVILIGSLLPFMVEGLPPSNVFMTILVGILVVLIGVMANGKAGLLRQKDEKAGQESLEGSSMLTGIFIAVGGGVLATGFSYANAVGRPIIHHASQMAGNAEWVTALAVMCVIYVCGGIPITIYFLYQLSKNKQWTSFRTSHLGPNVLLISIMAVFNFAASILFAFAAFKLGSSGNTVGYAIFNTVCVAVAILSGIFTGEWNRAGAGAKKFLYAGLAFMIIGVVIIALGNGLA
ncbi:L-rhamnose-proton symport protein RhaT [Dyadobacter jejuensis]|uniref:L-rhamnose-proton symport protein RhaT n=1 Tax=Dyadobacter jejuensis TaxID=1082580 RepID=A0A316AL96_9BACT|nr:L-rhamnose/proton symporter RhaT [Dyadobacter jejuensis]PWJ58029.1 L-rhamnose-proton symport protein RhaT [Dyadobacter jejuensis]